MEIPNIPGNKKFPCPSCRRDVQVSIRIGYQEYSCSRSGRVISIPEQMAMFSECGKTIGIDSYNKKIKGVQDVIIVGRFPILSEWAFQVAVRQGYPEMEAYSLALSRARASGINQIKRTIPDYTYDGLNVTPIKKHIVQQSTIQVIEKRFMGLFTPITIRPDGQIRGIYMKNDIPQLCKPDMFEQIVVQKMRNETYKMIHITLHKLANIFSGKDLENYGTFLWNLFAPVTKDGNKPPPGEPGYFKLAVIRKIIEDFTIPKYK